MLPHVNTGAGGPVPCAICDPNSTTVPLHSTPGEDSSILGTQAVHALASSEYVSPVFGLPPHPSRSLGRATPTAPVTLQWTLDS